MIVLGLDVDLNNISWTLLDKSNNEIITAETSPIDHGLPKNTNNSPEMRKKKISNLLNCFKFIYEDIVEKYGYIDIIHLEKYSKALTKYEYEMDKSLAMEEISSLFNITMENITDNMILRYRLFKEQKGVCVYSFKNLEISRIMDGTYCNIDHIIPISKTGDDSYDNKVLVLVEENQYKENMTSYEYMIFNNTFYNWNAVCEKWKKTYKEGSAKLNNLMLTNIKNASKAHKYREYYAIKNSFVKKIVGYLTNQKKPVFYCTDEMIDIIMSDQTINKESKTTRSTVIALCDHGIKKQFKFSSGSMSTEEISNAFKSLKVQEKISDNLFNKMYSWLYKLARLLYVEE